MAGTGLTREHVPQVVEPAVGVLGIHARPLLSDGNYGFMDEDEGIYLRIRDGPRRQGFEDVEAHHRANVGVLDQDDLSLTSLDLRESRLRFPCSRSLKVVRSFPPIWDDPRRAVELVDDIIAVQNFQMRDDGTPRYRMVRKFGPLTMSFISDYYVFERPHRHINRTHESPLGGNFYGIYEPTAGGTRVHWRWEVEPQNTLVGLLLPVMRPLLAWSLQRDLNAAAKAAKNYQTIKAALQARGESS